MRQQSKNSKNLIQNVRVIDKEEGGDDLLVTRLLSQLTVSESQIRVICSYRTEVTPGSGSLSALYDFSVLAGTDDFVSFSAQFTEFRVRAIRADIYDINPGLSSVVNYWASYHVVGGTPPLSIEDIVDRPDSRVLAPNQGKIQLAWVAHGQPEMEFQSISNYVGVGGIVGYISAAASGGAPKYTTTVKYIVDFRGRR